MKKTNGCDDLPAEGASMEELQDWARTRGIDVISTDPLQRRWTAHRDGNLGESTCKTPAEAIRRAIRNLCLAEKGNKP